MKCHPERRLARILRQSQSKDLRLGTSTYAMNFRDRTPVWCFRNTRSFAPTPLLTGIGHMPHGAAPVVGDEQRPVLSDRDPHRAAPDLAVGSDKAGQEVVVLAGGVAVVQGNVDHLVAGAVLAVPAAMLRGKGVASVAGGKLARVGMSL